MSRTRWASLASLLAIAILALPAPGQQQSPPPTQKQQVPRKTQPKAQAKAKPAAKPKVKEVDPTVTPKDQQRTSSFLRPPGADRYDRDDTDWNEIPPWRQTEFFGIRAKGQFFIYVVDCSGSMIDDDRLVRAKRELRRSVNHLQTPQRFKVIFYNDEPIAMPGDLPRSADQNSKDQLTHWLRLIEPNGETDPKVALGLALAMRPDAVFLLSDGEFPDGTVEAIAKQNARKIPIHCVDLGSELSGDDLRKISRDSSGQYRWRPQAAE